MTTHAIPDAYDGDPSGDAPRAEVLDAAADRVPQGVSPAPAVPVHVFAAVGGSSYAFRTVGQCHTCQSPYRDQIEAMIITLYSPAAIVRAIPDHDRKPSAASIRKHRDEHMPAHQVLHAIENEELAKKRGVQVETAEMIYSGPESALRAFIRSCEQQLAAGVPAPLDKLPQAQKVLLDAQKLHGRSRDAEVAVEALDLFWRNAKQILAPDDFNALVQAVLADPRYRHLHASAQQEAQGELAAAR